MFPQHNTAHTFAVPVQAPALITRLWCAWDAEILTLVRLMELCYCLTANHYPCLSLNYRDLGSARHWHLTAAHQGLLSWAHIPKSYQLTLEFFKVYFCDCKFAYKQLTESNPCFLPDMF